MDAQTNESQDSYQIISSPGPRLPESYRAIIYSRFMRSLRFGNDYFRLIDSDAYYRSYEKYIDVLLSRSGCVIHLAVLTDNHDVVLGWSMFENEKLHYVHVGKDYRKMGIAKELCHSPFTTITHLTKCGASIWNNKIPHVKFIPF